MNDINAIEISYVTRGDETIAGNGSVYGTITPPKIDGYQIFVAVPMAINNSNIFCFNCGTNGQTVAFGVTNTVNSTQTFKFYAACFYKNTI